MILQLVIENFRCLRHVTLDLEPLTVFVGANGSGKSSVFAALSPSNAAANHWGRGTDSQIEVIARHADGQCSTWGNRSKAHHITGSWQLDAPVLQFLLEHLRSANQVSEARALNRTGYELANVFGTLTRREQDQVSKSFCDLVPIFADVVTRPLASGSHRIQFQDRWHPSLWYEPDQVSDGSMLMLAFLLLPYQSPTPNVIAIEEPERGLHPYLMSQLVSTLRKLATGAIGPKPVQILLATHSAELLEFVEPREVRFFRRSKDTGETIDELAPTNDPNWLKTLREYEDSLGDLWLSGGLGGVPGR